MISLKFLHKNEIYAQLLEKGTFDSFLLREVLLIGDYTFHIQPSDDASEPIAYGQIRPMLGDFLKLSSPDSIRGQIVLRASDAYQNTLFNHPSFTGDPELIKGLILTFRIENDHATALTGISHASFTLDRSIDSLWDQGIKKAFDNTSLSYELM
ncbi:MAG: DUF5721 family protein [Lachnospiraceae bacterium]|nr:DUF5721 family protein [Lachnospiraceae bacterium]